MIKFAKFALVSAALVTAAVSTASPVLAGGRHHDRYERPRHHRSNNDAAVLGLFGLAAGAVVGAAIASQPRYVEPGPIYVEPDFPPPPPRAYRPAPVYANEYPSASYRGDLEPWSPEWYRYCSDRYRSFNPRSGTFIGYDGRSHFCSAG
ncbi:BA14K family protein [Agrobacterium sp. ES01]|uniref:BA14K family protein n=1 Tax=Agrobacterium sp. ES01 TaxID=3420714 RepID=UPI003D1187F5